MTGQQGNSVGHDEVRKFYDNEYYAGTSVGHGLPWHMQVVANRLGSMDGCNVLDIACGTGAWLAELAGRGARASGIDISNRAVEQCRRCLPEADIREGVAEELPFEDSSFDLVTCLGSLEHFLDQPRALREMRRVAKPGAKVLVLVPNSGFLTRRLGLYGGTQQVSIRETVRSIDEWETLLGGAGLKIWARWRDLHPLSKSWIMHGPIYARPLRLVQALALSLWPLRWQYQVYFACRAPE